MGFSDSYGGVYLSDQYTAPLAGGETYQRQTNSVAIHGNGKHTFTITLDKDNSIQESNEGNNTITFVVNLSEPTATPVTPTSTPTPVTPTPVTPIPTRPKWTFMVYLDGDNNLEGRALPTFWKWLRLVLIMM